MRHLIAVAALAATAALTSCGPTVSYHRAPDVDLAPGTTWAWGPEDADGLPDRTAQRIPDDTVARMIRVAVEAELVAKGFPMTSRESAQLHLHFHVGQTLVTDTLPPRDDPPTDVRAPGSWGGYGRPEDLERTVTWEEGMLVVDAVTADRGVVAWRGLIAGEIPAAAEARPAEAIRAAVKRLMRGFP
jgi:Domain of unknown function (DUF4136)